MTPQEEKDLLLRVVTDLARRQIERGQLTPFAVTLGSKRNAQVLMSTDTDWEPDTSRDELAEYWTRELSEVIVQGETRAVGYCAGARVPAAEGKTAPGVVVHLEHAEGGAEDILYRCGRDETSKVVLGEPASIVARRHIFAS
jgi:hypothetical protein